MVFKKIYFKGKETNYSVSDEGQVRNDKFNRIMKGTCARNEYYSVQLSLEEGVKTFMVHRLVAEAFCEKEREDCTIVDHIDRDKSNNKASNLRWVTSQENALNSERQQKGVQREKADLAKEWVSSISLPGYSVNKDGELKNDKDNYLLKGSLRNGYLRIKHSLGNFSKHHLIWEAFNGEVPEGMVIDHIDGNRSNNSLSNLRLVTQSENMNNAQALGHKGQIKISQYDTEGNYIATYNSIREAANAISGNEVAIKDASIRHGSSAGYLWLREGDPVSIKDVVELYNSKKIKSTYLGVTQCSESGEVIAHYNSIKEAARAIGCSDSTIRRAANANRLGKGYYWILDSQK